jgi:hypothetical protein
MPAIHTHSCLRDDSNPAYHYYNDDPDDLQDDVQDWHSIAPPSLPGRGQAGRGGDGKNGERLE